MVNKNIGKSRERIQAMSIYDALMLMLTFAMFVIALLTYINKK